MPTRSTGDYLDESRVTYPDPAGFISRENDCDERDAITYKFNNESQVLRQHHGFQNRWPGFDSLVTRQSFQGF